MNDPRGPDNAAPGSSEEASWSRRWMMESLLSSALDDGESKLSKPLQMGLLGQFPISKEP